MIQLILHYIGDYVTQSDWMANGKQWYAGIAIIHALVYAIPFAWIAPSFAAWTVIFVTHAFIDHFDAARYLVFAKNFLAPRWAWPKWEDCKGNHGYPSRCPAWMSTWLKILADNTLHLAINAAAIAWL